MMIRGFGRHEHSSRRFEEFDSEDNEVDETMVSALCSVEWDTTHVHMYLSSLP